MQLSISVNKLIYLLAFLRFILPFVVVDGIYELHRDEYLYIAQSAHPALGYMEVPPMLSILSKISSFFGPHEFFIKFWPGLLGSFTFIVAAKTATELGGKYFSVILCFFGFVLTGYIRLFYLFHPNFLDVFFWTLSGYAVFKFIRTDSNVWLYVLGMSIGLGFISKYSMAFYTVGLLTATLLTKKRTVLLNKHFWFSLVIAFIIFSPNLYWQYRHQFPVITHMKELQEEQLQFVSPFTFILGQLLIFLPVLFIWLNGLYFTGFSSQGKEYRLFAWLYAAVITLLLLGKGKDYYAAGLYPMLIGFGAFSFEQYWYRTKLFLKYIPVVLCVMIGVVFFPVMLPVAKPQNLSTYYHWLRIEKTGVLKWEDGKNHELPQDFADMIGWKNLAERTAKVYHSLPREQQKQTMIYCRGYFTAGALNYHRKKFNLPEVYSDNASFLLWMPEQYHISHLLFLGHHIPDADDKVFTLFEKSTLKDSAATAMFRERGMKIVLYENGTDSLNYFIEAGIREMKKEFLKSD